MLSTTCMRVGACVQVTFRDKTRRHGAFTFPTPHDLYIRITPLCRGVPVRHIALSLPIVSLGASSSLLSMRARDSARKDLLRLRRGGVLTLTAAPPAATTAAAPPVPPSSQPRPLQPRAARRASIPFKYVIGKADAPDETEEEATRLFAATKKPGDAAAAPAGKVGPTTAGSDKKAGSDKVGSDSAMTTKPSRVVVVTAPSTQLFSSSPSAVGGGENKRSRVPRQLRVAMTEDERALAKTRLPSGRHFAFGQQRYESLQRRRAAALSSNGQDEDVMAVAVPAVERGAMSSTGTGNERRIGSGGSNASSDCSASTAAATATAGNNGSGSRFRSAEASFSTAASDSEDVVGYDDEYSEQNLLSDSECTADDAVVMEGCRDPASSTGNAATSPACGVAATHSSSTADSTTDAASVLVRHAYHEMRGPAMGIIRWNRLNAVLHVFGRMVILEVQCRHGSEHFDDTCVGGGLGIALLCPLIW